MEPARIDADELRRTADAARITLTDEEVERFRGEFPAIFEAVRRLETVPPAAGWGAEPAPAPPRPDAPLSRDPGSLLEGVPRTGGGYVVAPREAAAEPAGGAAPRAPGPAPGTIPSRVRPGPFADRDAAGIAAAVREGALRATDVLEEALAGLPGAVSLRALLPPSPAAVETARRRAGEIDRQVRRGEDPGPLAGVPVAVKDNLCTGRLPTTCASRILAGFVAPFAATVIERLEAAGAVVLARANMDEFAMGSTGETSAHGAPGNPHDPGRVAGGSSGGSAAAVAGGFVPVAIGTETGGSIRQPAALCGVVGLRPPWGRVPRHGLVALASSLDQAGPLARSARDAALVYRVIAGPDARDATTIREPLPPLETTPGGSLTGLRVGIPAGPLEHPGLEEAIRDAVGRARDELRARGARVETVRLPHAGLAIPAYHVLVAAEAASNLARYDGIRYGRAAGGRTFREAVSRTRGSGFGAEVKRRILLGTWVLRAGWHRRWLDRAAEVRRRLAGEAADLFRRVDLLLGPVTPTRAFPLGSGMDPLAVWLCDVFVLPANLADLPALALPLPANDGGLPAAVQLVAPRRREDLLFRAAAHLEEAGFRPPAPPAP